MSVRPSLPPGTTVVRRDVHHLQIGTDPGVLVRDRPGLVGLLRLLDGVRDVQQLTALAGPEIAGEIPSVVTELLARGALVDARPPARARLDVAVRCDPPTQQLAGTVRAALRELDLAPAGTGGPSLHVHLSTGEPARSRIQPLAATGLAHLLISTAGPQVRLGPLVVPGISPCLTCLDLGQADQDPTWPVVVAQSEGPPIAIGPAGVAATTRWAVAAAVARDVRALVAGRRPRSAGAVLLLGPDGEHETSRPVTFHHGCGCWLLGAP